MNVLSLFGITSTTVTFVFEGEARATIQIPQEEDDYVKVLNVFHSEEPVQGYVMIQTSKVEHEGIKIELLGVVDTLYDSNNSHDFMMVSQNLSPPGVLQGDTQFNFDFGPEAEKIHESYSGINVRLRYFLRLTISRSFMPDTVEEQEFWVLNFQNPPELNSSIKMEVGIEDCLHIEFEYGRSKYHLRDVILGKIYFLLVRVRIKHMELALVKQELTGTLPHVYTDTETLSRFEIMDGNPVKDESIPVRLFLGAFDLTPTYKNICNKFSVRYLLNLIIVDDEDRRYFKQTDISLWRKSQSDSQKTVCHKDMHISGRNVLNRKPT